MITDSSSRIERARAHVSALAAKKGAPLKACVVTFGCQMNARDSEKLSGVLRDAGYILSDDEDSADFVIYNTCTVRENADNRLYGRLGRISGFKKKNPYMKIALCGCMMQEQGTIERLKESYRFVDLIFGTFNLYRFAELLTTMFESDRMVIDVWKEAGEIVEDLPVERKYPFKSGVNIMFGCNNYCSYCIVPYVRGPERSRKRQDILSEIKSLAADGVKEVMLLGQNVNSYGRGLSEEEGGSFPALLRDVCAVEGIDRVRFMSSHPKDLSDELIEVFASEQKVARHLHLALQSGSDAILKKMNRHYTKEHYLSLVDKLRNAAPDVAITTDIIVGFPGETAADVDDTIDAIKRAAFENAFTFIYSKRTGTPAAAMFDENPPDEARVKEDFDRVLKTVQDTAASRSGRFTGETADVLVEEVNPRDDTLLTGRMSNNMLVHFEGDRDLIGSFVRVKLTECKGFYYIGCRG